MTLADFEGAENTPEAPPASGAGESAHLAYDSPSDGYVDDGGSGSVEPTPAATPAARADAQRASHDNAQNGVPGQSTGDGGGAEEREGYIPRERFDQVNTRLQQAEPQAELGSFLLEQLADDPRYQAFTQAGHTPRQAFEAIIRLNATQGEEMSETDEALQAWGENQGLDADGLEELKGILNPILSGYQEARPFIETARQKALESQVTQALDNFSATYPDMDADVVKQVLTTNGYDAAELAAARSHARTEALLRAERSKVAAGLAPAANVPAVESGGPGSAPATKGSGIPDPNTDPEAFAAYTAEVKRRFYS